MTWVELIYFIISGIAIMIFVIGSFLEGFVMAYTFAGISAGVIFSGILALPTALIFHSNTTKKTCEVPVNVIMEKLDDNKLIMVVDNNELLSFDKFSDIQKWKNGEKLIRSYYFEKCNFGLDYNYSEVTFK